MRILGAGMLWLGSALRAQLHDMLCPFFDNVQWRDAVGIRCVWVSAMADHETKTIGVTTAAGRHVHEGFSQTHVTKRCLGRIWIGTIFQQAGYDAYMVMADGVSQGQGSVFGKLVHVGAPFYQGFDHLEIANVGHPVQCRPPHGYAMVDVKIWVLQKDVPYSRIIVHERITKGRNKFLFAQIHLGVWVGSIGQCRTCSVHILIADGGKKFSVHVGQRFYHANVFSMKTCMCVLQSLHVCYAQGRQGLVQAAQVVVFRGGAGQGKMGAGKRRAGNGGGDIHKFGRERPRLADDGDGRGQGALVDGVAGVLGEDAGSQRHGVFVMAVDKEEFCPLAAARRIRDAADETAGNEILRGFGQGFSHGAHIHVEGGDNLRGFIGNGRRFRLACRGDEGFFFLLGFGRHGAADQLGNGEVACSCLVVGGRSTKIVQSQQAGCGHEDDGQDDTNENPHENPLF